MTNRLGDLISRGEGGYNSYNRGTLHGRIVPAAQQIDFSRMNLDELLRRQHLSISDPDKIFAVGKYQLIPSTMEEAVSRLHLDGELKYDPEVQERIFSDFLIRTKRPAIYKYIVGHQDATLHSAQKAACQEWASIEDPDTPGKPFGDYAKHGNRSSIRSEEVAVALHEMQLAYKADIAQGMSSTDAWRFVTGQVANERMPTPSRTGVWQQEPSPVSPVTDLSRSLQPTYDVSDDVRCRQESLGRLGYRGLKGRPLVADGSFGPNTRHAVKSFQRAHGLRVDGVVGRHTLAALENAQRWPLLSEATHPHHTLYDQVAQGIHRMPQLHGKKDLDNAAVALTVAADAAGMRRIDHVVLGSDGVNLFAVQGRLDDPAHRRVHVELAHAMTHPAEHHSMSTAPGHVQAIAAQQQAVQPRGPVMMGP